MAGSKWQISDELWGKMAPLLPEHKTSHPLGTHRRRVDNRAAMDAIFFVLRTGCQWNALNGQEFAHHAQRIGVSSNCVRPGF